MFHRSKKRRNKVHPINYNNNDPNLILKKKSITCSVYTCLFSCLFISCVSI